MKKKYLAASAILITFLLVTPFLFGQFIQNHYAKTLTLIARNAHVNLKIIDYKRSWLSSDATIVTNFPLTDKPLNLNKEIPERVLVIKQHIYHGPVIFYHNPNHTGIKFAIAYIDSFFDQQHHFAQSTLALTKNFTTKLHLNKYTLFENNKIIYCLNGLEGIFFVNASQKQFFSDLKLNYLYANLDQPRKIQQFASTHELTKHNNNIWLGKNTYHFDSLSWQQGSRQFTFNNFDFDIDTKSANELITANISSHIQSVLLNNQNYGAQEFSATAFNLDPDSLKNLQNYLFMLDDPKNSPIAFKQQFTSLISKGAIFDINSLALNTAWGKINVNAKVTCPCDTNKNLANLAAKIKININAQFPIAFVTLLLTDYYLLNHHHYDPVLAKNRADESLAAWQKTGWLNSVGDNFFINLQR